MVERTLCSPDFEKSPLYFGMEGVHNSNVESEDEGDKSDSEKEIFRRRSHKWRGIFSLWLNCIAEDRYHPPFQSEQKFSRRVSLTLPQPWHSNILRVSACLFWCWCGLDLHNIQETLLVWYNWPLVYIQPREGEGIYCIWQDPQTIFGGKEATRYRFATDINDKHLSFDEKFRLSSVVKEKFVDWFACFRTG